MGEASRNIARSAAIRAHSGPNRVETQRCINAVTSKRSPWPSICNCPLTFTVNVGSADLKEKTMGKYLLAWLLGVPGALLVLVYLFTHV